MKGISLIIHERQRQISIEGWDAKNDDVYTDGSLVIAAICYADAAAEIVRGGCGWKQVPDQWPWDEKWWKPSDDPLRNLAKAGALIAAEVDRLNRKRGIIDVETIEVECWAYGPAEETTISEALAENRVIKVKQQKDGRFQVREMCDEFYGATLSPLQLAMWGSELIELSMSPPSIQEKGGAE